jgi:hypothetical protein
VWADKEATECIDGTLWITPQLGGDPGHKRRAEPEDIVYTLLSPEVHRILTIVRRWSADRYERWLARSFRALMVTLG